MALPTSGNLSFSQIIAEFGGGAGAKLTDYYRGGARVPDTAANAGVPTSGQISIRQFLGASATVANTITKSGDAYGYLYDEFGTYGESTAVSSDRIFFTGTNLTGISSWNRVSGSVMAVSYRSSDLSMYFTSDPVWANTTNSAVYRIYGNNGAYVDVNVYITYESPYW